MTNRRLAAFFRGTRALYVVLAPLLAALAVTALYLVPHLLDVITGNYHSAHDADAADPGAPAPWVLIVLAVFVVRAALRLAQEARLSLRLRRGCVMKLEIALAARARRLVERLAGQVRGVHPPDVLVHQIDEYREPFLRGGFRPALYIHEEILGSLDEQYLVAVALHEMEHRRGRDHMIAWVYSLVIGPLGLSREIRRRYQMWRAAREIQCDDFAASTLGSPRTVAEAIVAVVRCSLSGTPLPRGALGFGGAGDLVRHRVERLLGASQSLTEGPGRNEEAASAIELYCVQVLAGQLVMGALLLSWATPEVGLGLFCRGAGADRPGEDPAADHRRGQRSRQRPRGLRG